MPLPFFPMQNPRNLNSFTAKMLVTLLFSVFIFSFSFPSRYFRLDSIRRSAARLLLANTTLSSAYRTMASADFLQFVVTAAFGFSYFPSARPPRVSATAFLPCNRHIYRTGFGQHWTSCCLAHSSVPVRPTM